MKRADLLAAAAALTSGLLFAAGLVLSGMALPAKVLAFLDLGALASGVSWHAQRGLWDPSLALVMGGALGVTLLAFATTPKRPKPWLAERFELPNRSHVDMPLLLGAALFGVGWGLVGYCPGPALASLLVSWQDAGVFSAAMLATMALTKKLQ